MKLTMITLLLLLSTAACRGQDSLLVVFWNVENFFDYRSDKRPAYWTRGRFYRKCDAVAKTMFRIAGEYGRFPDIIAMSEVENSYVPARIADATLLRKLGYRTVHYESPDWRGIDCALLYRKGPLELTGSRAVHLRDSTGAVMSTRDILVAEFSDFAVLVNHHPSKLGGKTYGRTVAMATMNMTADSLLRAGTARILSVGDFNDDVWMDGGQGTIKYNGGWEKIDGCFVFGDIAVEEHVFDDPMLMTEDRNFGGQKPSRTFLGPSYNGGVSDHLPVVFLVTFHK